MNSIEIHLLVEGQTEQTFVRDVLAPEMSQKNIFLHPSLIGKRGGDVRFDRAKNDIGNFLMQRKDTYVSIMIDYFRLDSSWPGYEELSLRYRSGVKLPSIEKARVINQATYKEIVRLFIDYGADSRFIPYVEMHEFEALLFSDANILATKINVGVREIEKIIKNYENPEEINDSPDNATSKRLLALKHDYRKVAMGKEIAETIGVKTIRERCPNFNDWLCNLEAIIGRK